MMKKPVFRPNERGGFDGWLIRREYVGRSTFPRATNGYGYVAGPLLAV